MYDTTHFWLYRHDVPDIDYVANQLSQARDIVSRESGEVYTAGNLGNLKVNVTMAGLSIKGSLAKYYHPDNTYQLTRHQVKDAIGMLSDTLHINMFDAKVTRLDLSANFILKYPIPHYFDVLGMHRYFDRIQTQKETLYYQSRGQDHKRTLCFYDKAKEVKQHSGFMPDVFAGANLLRYESRWSRRLPQQLKEPEVIGKTLFDSRFYQKAVGLWADSYFSINKKRELKLNIMERIKTVKDAEHYIFAIALGRLPPDELQSILEDLKANKVFNNRKYYSQLNQRIKKLATNEELTEANTLVRELDTEIKNILAYPR